MTWTQLGQYLDLFLSLILLTRIFQLGLHRRYAAIFVFIAFEAIESIAYLIILYFYNRGPVKFDYRIIWDVMTVSAWIATIWMVYSLLASCLKHLPGIRRFSLRFLNIVFAVWIMIGLFTVRPEYAANHITSADDLTTRATVFIDVLDRSLATAELLTILCVLGFVLRFPIRVPRNLSTFSAGLSIFLLLQIGLQLLRTYFPNILPFEALSGIPGYFFAACLVYWIISINVPGEAAEVTLGRHWQTVPQDHLVRQLEAMNAALLRSREQT